MKITLAEFHLLMRTLEDSLKLPEDSTLFAMRRPGRLRLAEELLARMGGEEVEVKP